MGRSITSTEGGSREGEDPQQAVLYGAGGETGGLLWKRGGSSEAL